MANLNTVKVIVGGRLTKDPKECADHCVLISIASTPNKDRQTQFFTAFATGRNAETLSRYFRKGSSILVIGDLSVDKEAKSVIYIQSLSFVDSKNERPIDNDQHTDELP